MGGALGINRLRATVAWPLSFVVLFLIVFKAEADSPQLSLRLCRANVEPCQSDLSIPQGGEVDLDLVLDQTGTGGGTFGIVGWEVHLRLTDSSVAGLTSKATSGQPVQERGEPELALDSLAPLQDGGNQGSGQYFTAQNQYDASSGHLDYAVTLLRFDPAKPQPRVLPFSSQSPLRLGRTTVSGVAPGNVEISPQVSLAHPIQAVILNASGAISPASVSSPSGSLATISVGNVTTPELRGQISPVPDLPTELTVSFWQSGAVPAWKGGSALPVATFSRVPTDSSGVFRITDMAPSILPPGIYDMRVKAPGTLASLTPDVTVPGAGGTGTPLIANAVSLREGDIDGNNVVDGGDLQALIDNFGRPESDAGFDSAADINGDSVVDVLDFTRLAQNFGLRSD